MSIHKRSAWLRALTLVTAAAAIGCSGDAPVAPTSRPTPRAVSPADAPRPLAVITMQLPEGQVGQPYDLLNSTGLVGTGGTRPYRWTLTQGTLPAGLTLRPDGTITGTPTTKGFSGGLVFTLTDATGATVQTRQLSINVDDPKFAVFIRGLTTPVPGAGAMSGERATTITMRVTYVRNGTTVNTTVTLNVPARSTPEDVLKAIQPAIQAALGADFDIALQTGAANPRIEITAKAGVTLGSNKPNFGGTPVTFQVPTGRIRVAVSFTNQQ